MAIAENSPQHQVVQQIHTPGMGAQFITPAGDPIPPVDVVRELQMISPRLSIEWVKGAWGTSYFGLKERWRDGDPRWERVRTGELSEAQAFDLLTMFPPECRTGDMVGWVRNRWGDRGIVKDPRKEADRLVEQARKLYAEAEASAVDQAVATGTRRIQDESDHTRLVRAGYERAHPMVSGVGEGPKRLIPIQPAPAEAVTEVE